MLYIPFIECIYIPKYECKESQDVTCTYKTR